MHHFIAKTLNSLAYDQGKDNNGGCQYLATNSSRYWAVLTTLTRKLFCLVEPDSWATELQRTIPIRRSSLRLARL